MLALLVWCQKNTAGYRDVNVTNFSTSWKSGLAWCALIHKFRPELIEYDALSKDNAESNVRLAFDAAEKIGIVKLLDVEDVLCTKPDDKCVWTYTSQYPKILDPSVVKTPGKEISDSEQADTKLKGFRVKKNDVLVKKPAIIEHEPPEKKPVDIDDAKHLSESPKDEKAVLRLESTCPITSNLKQKLAEDDPKVPVKKKVVIPAITVESEDPKSPQQQSPHQSTPRHPLTDSSVKRRDDRVVTNDLRKSVDQNPPPPQHPPVSRPQHHQPPHPSPHQHHPHDREHTAHPTQPTTQHEGRPEQDHQTPHPPQKHSRSGKFATSATSPKVEAPASPGQPQTPLKNSSSGHPKSPPGPSPSPKSPPVLSPAPKSPSPKLASPIMTPTTPNKSTNGTPHGVGLGVRANIGNRNTNRLLRGDGSRSGSRRMVPPKSGKAKVRSSAGSSAESHTDFSSEAHSSHHGGEGVGFGTTSRMCPPSSTPHSSSPFSSSHHSPVLSTPTLLGVGSYFTTTTTTTTTTTATTTTAANIDPTTTPVLGGAATPNPQFTSAPQPQAQQQTPSPTAAATKHPTSKCGTPSSSSISAVSPTIQTPGGSVATPIQPPLHTSATAPNLAAPMSVPASPRHAQRRTYSAAELVVIVKKLQAKLKVANDELAAAKANNDRLQMQLNGALSELATERSRREKAEERLSHM